MKKLFNPYLIVIIGIFLTQICGAQTPENLKVISYNIWNGFDWGKDEERRGKLVEWVKSQNPDVVALQELCGYTESKLLEDAKKWGHEYVVILKEDGYPVGLTSSKPIQLKEKVREGLWHGMLHCRTWGVDFFVVHLSPADRAFRVREAAIITEKVKTASDLNPYYVVLGDFNAHSPFDGDLDKQHPKQLARTRLSDQKNEKHENLLDGEHDYGVISKFLSLPLIDVCQRYVSTPNRFTFPAPALVGVWQTSKEVKENKHRLDYILVSPQLAKKSTGAGVHNGSDTGPLADHYPVSASFGLD